MIGVLFSLNSSSDRAWNKGCFFIMRYINPFIVNFYTRQQNEKEN